ncbi:MAG: AI-2E family transporter [Sphingobacteriales bacterium]|nr:AI-2E family transporter [Sphingobacteriales bacterium]
MKHIELAARIFIGLVLIAVFTLIWIYLGNIVIYVLLAALLGLIGRPFVRSLCNIKIGKYHLPRPLAAIFTLLMFYLVLVLLSMIFIPYVFSPLSQLADIDVDALVQYLDGPYHQLRTFLMQYGIIPQNTPYSPTQFIVENIKKALDFEKAGSVVRSLFGVLGNVANIITGLFSVTFISYFFMVDEKMSYHILMTIVPSQYEKRTKKVLNTSSYFLSRYLKGLVIQNIIFTFLITTAMWLLGVDNAILIGVVAGFSNIIPYVGPIIGGFFALFITITANVGIDFSRFYCHYYSK